MDIKEDYLKNFIYKKGKIKKMNTKRRIIMAEFASLTDEELRKRAEELRNNIRRLSMERSLILKEISRRKRWVQYEEFKNKILKLLTDETNGLTWAEIKQKLDLPQRVPSNKWVRMLERDIGLIRIKEARGIVWRLSKWMK
jgi:hypothetical protein